MKTLKSLSELGQIIASTRKEQGMTQEQLAAACGVGIRFIGELENGKEGCHAGKVFLVVQMLGLNLTVLSREEACR